MYKGKIRVECTGADTLPLDQIKPFQDDLKTITPENLRKLKKSIIEYGISTPTQIWCAKDGTTYTLDGHQRLIAYYSLKANGWEIPEIPVVYVDAPDEDYAREKLMIATSSYGEFNAAGVQKYVDKIKNKARIKNVVKLSNVNIERVLAVLESKTDPDETPIAAVEKTVTKTGDVWLLGRHRLICGDSRDKVVTDRLLNGDKCRLIVCDPPYGVSYQPQWREKIDLSSNRKNGIVVNDNQCVFEDTFRNLDADVVYYFHAAVKSLEILESFINHLDYRLYSELIWYKSNGAPLSRSHWAWNHEPIFYLVKKARTANWVHNDHTARTVIQCPNQNPFGGHFSKNKFDNLNSDPDTRTEHSTQKPVHLLQEIIRHHETDIIVDPFLGSGSTLIACHALGDKKCYGVEISENYCDLILNRYSAFTGDDPIREVDGKKYSELKNETQQEGK